MKHDVYIGIGSNLGDRAQNCRLAIDHIKKIPNTIINPPSKLYESRPFHLAGAIDQPSFINCAVQVSTKLLPHELLISLQWIEAALGRPVMRDKGSPRTIDLDILLYDDEIIDLPDLKIPHPGLTKRLFVLIPLYDIAPALTYPGDGIPIEDILNSCLAVADPADIPKTIDR